jgi:hypothetical protein
LLLGFTNLAIANTYNSVEYNLDLISIKDSVLKIEVILKGDFKDKLVLDLPSRWAGTSYVDQIKNIEVSPNYSVELKQENNNSQAIISIPKTSNNLVKITYEVHQKIGNPSNVHEAIVRDDLVHTTGYGIFATPFDLNENDKINVAIKWINLDSKWKTISSHGAKSNINLNITAPELLHAIYVAGRIRVYNVGTDSQPILLSLYGHFDIEDKRIASDL